MPPQPRRTIRFFADWGADFPLWESGTDSYLMAPEDYGLPASLSERLRAWATHWTSHCHWDTGWDDPHAAEYSQKEGDELLDALRTHVASFADVIDAR
ncbi:hypothetical protein GCM10027595_01440 [Corynebacterium nasicanis]